MDNGGRTPLSVWYDNNPAEIAAFEKQMRRKAHYVIQPKHLWTNIAHMARTQDKELLNTLQEGFKYIENESFESTFSGLFSEINLGSEKLGKTYQARNAKLCTIITKIAEGLAQFSTDSDTLTNDWDMLREQNPAKKPTFDAVVANPPFSYRWDPNDALAEDMRFKNHELAPKSAADFAFLLHGFHYLKDDGVMATILPHGVLFRGGKEKAIREKLLKDGHIDTVIGLPANLFYSTGIPVCILVLKKCKKPDDVLIINASAEGNFEKGKRQNYLNPEHIKKIIDTYQHRNEEKRYARPVTMEEIEENDYNLNISRYVSTAEADPQVDLSATHELLVEIEKEIRESTAKHNEFLKELGLSPLPAQATENPE